MIDNSDILSFLKSIENDASLYEERNFSRRADAIGDLEFYLADGVNEPTLKLYAEKIKAALEEVDNKLFDKLRAGIRSGKYLGHAFKKLLAEYSGVTASAELTGQPEYDNLDVFVNRLSPFDKMPEPAEMPEREMVFYQKTPARVVLELVERCHFRQEDVFVDIGSGLGQAAILVNLLAGIKTIGVEFDPAFCEYARVCAGSLGLEDVTFIHADARYADYTQGTIFFMFTPFRGQMLLDVLGRLKTESLSRKIKLVTYGPCTIEVTDENWLKKDDADPTNLYRPAFFYSV